MRTAIIPGVLVACLLLGASTIPLGFIVFAANTAQPGRFPFTRGIHADMYRHRVWTKRQFAGFGSARQTKEGLTLSVRPSLVPQSTILASVQAMAFWLSSSSAVSRITFTMAPPP